MHKLYFGFDGNKYIADGLINPSSHVGAVVLAANVAQVFSVPEGAGIVLFSATGDFYVKFGGAAEIPTDAVNDGSASTLNPAVRRINDIATIGLISPMACVVTMEFYLP